MDRKLWNRQADALLKVILGLEFVREARRFFRDLMTEDELRMIVGRWQVARMLHDGATYKEIEAKTGFSSRTVARISRWLQEGEGGYRHQLHTKRA